MELAEAFARIGSDKKLAAKFVDDPEGVLTIMGIDTTDLVIQPVIGVKDPFKADAQLRSQGPKALPIVVNVCASVGFFVCASVGTDVDTDDIFGAIDQQATRA